MKILLLFFDMVRINLSNVYNNKNPSTRFDAAISEIGGTLYTNCYTPSPDTPRSLACLWSSTYPKFNKCDNRLKYPQFYLETNEDLLSVLRASGYSFNIFLKPHERNLGEMPLSVAYFGNYSTEEESLSDYLNRLELKDNSLTFIGLDDFHEVISDCFARRKYIITAFNLVGEAINLINQKLEIDSFDLTIIFSDHGFKAMEENLDSDLKMLGESRTQLLMFSHLKGQKGITYNDKLSSIMDIYPSVLQKCGLSIPNIIHGKNLFDNEDVYEWLLIEDHKNFGVSLGQTIERWAIKTNKNMVSVDCSLNWESNYTISSEKKNYYKMLLSKYGSCFDDNIRLQKIHDYYDVLVKSGTKHFNGTVRKIHKPFTYQIRDTIKLIFEFIENIFKKNMYR